MTRPGRAGPVLGPQPAQPLLGVPDGARAAGHGRGAADPRGGGHWTGSRRGRADAAARLSSDLVPDFVPRPPLRAAAGAERAVERTPARCAGSAPTTSSLPSRPVLVHPDDDVRAARGRRGSRPAGTTQAASGCVPPAASVTRKIRAPRAMLVARRALCSGLTNVSKTLNGWSRCWGARERSTGLPRVSRTGSRWLRGPGLRTAVSSMTTSPRWAFRSMKFATAV